MTNERETTSEHYHTGVCARCERATTEGLRATVALYHSAGSGALWSADGVLCPDCRAALKDWWTARAAPPRGPLAPDPDGRDEP